MKLSHIENTIFGLGVATCLLSCYTIPLLLPQIFFCLASLTLSIGIFENTTQKN